MQLLGVDFDALTEDEVTATILEAVAAGRGGWVLTPNLHILQQIDRSEETRELVRDADLVLADGVPVVWASRLQGTPLPETVPGSSLIYSLSAAAARRGASIFLLGGNPGVAEVAAQRLSEVCPGLSVAGTLSPPFGFEDEPEQLLRIRGALQAARPDIVFVGLGFPKQERLIAMLRPHLPTTWFLGVGIALSFAAGTVRRAPVAVRRLGLEWLYRVIQEPGRLYRRYLVQGLPFAARLFARVLVDRVRRHARA